VIVWDMDTEFDAAGEQKMVLALEARPLTAYAKSQGGLSMNTVDCQATPESIVYMADVLDRMLAVDMSPGGTEILAVGQLSKNTDTFEEEIIFLVLDPTLAVKRRYY